MISKKAIALCATVGVALSGVAIALPASAEPVSSSYVLVGSDTLQDVANALANGTSVTGTSVRAAAGGVNIGSFDATGATTIQTKSGGARFGRPNGSGDGVKALSRSIDGASYTAGTVGSPAATIAGQVDIARSSSAPKSTALNTNGVLAYLPFGRDALSYAYNSAATGIGSLTLAQLTDLYTCTTVVIGGVTITPLLPQTGSGTRTSFMGIIGVTDATLGGCVNQTIQENDGTVITNNTIAPYSVANWVAQKNQTGTDRTGSATLGTPISGVAAYSGTGTALTPNSAYYSNTTWGRDTYVVVEYARINSADAKYDAKLASLVDASLTKSLTNNGTTAGSAGKVKSKFGFGIPNSLTMIRSNAS